MAANVATRTKVLVTGIPDSANMRQYLE